MKNLFAFFSRFSREFLFLGLQVFCFYLIFTNSNYQKLSVISSANAVSGEVYTQKSNVTQYFNLVDENRKLAEENAVLKTKMKDSYLAVYSSYYKINDTLYKQQYEYRTANAINTTTNLQHNFITLDKGSLHGITADMGVLSPQGLVGVVVDVSNYFSTVLPIINTRFTSPVEIKRTGHFGLLKWNGTDIATAKIEDIANHALIVAGDTVITRESSGFYPAGKNVGVVEEVNQPEGSNYLDLTIKLTTDFSSLKKVYVVSNLLKQEKDILEEVMMEDEEE